MPSSSPPLIGIPCGVRLQGEHPAHMAMEKYILAARDGTGCLPLLVPALGERIDVPALLSSLDGLLLTGSPSNIEPRHYGGAPSAPGTLHDPARDATTLPLIKAASAADLPILAICLGFEELNVALGGSLYQKVQEVPGKLDHREPEGFLERRYAYDAHAVTLTPGGLLAELAGGDVLTVNSLHSQGIDRLGDGLAVEAVAPDGLIEAVRFPTARFIVGVQWHPEWRPAENAFSRALFAAFGAACRQRAQRRNP